MEKVKGYLTVDGQFFKNEESARLHEAEERLTDAMVAAGFSPAKVINLLNQHPAIIREYLDAYQAAPEEVVSLDVAQNPFDDTGTDEDPTSTFEQSVGSDEPMSDLGGDSQSTRVRNKRTRNGTRSR